MGKTVVAAVIARTHAEAGERVAVFKPAVSGLEERRRTGPRAAPPRLRLGAVRRRDRALPLRPPGLTAPRGGAGRGADRARRAWSSAAHGRRRPGDFLVAEGVGGLLVPLTLGYLVRDLARELALPLVIAASPGPGHDQPHPLTVEAARAVGLEVAAVVAHAVARRATDGRGVEPRRDRAAGRREGRDAGDDRPRGSRALAGAGSALGRRADAVLAGGELGRRRHAGRRSSPRPRPRAGSGSGSPRRSRPRGRRRSPPSSTTRTR